MEKRSRRRIRDLVARPASLGLSENEIGCARISMMARNTNVPFKGRIQKRKTYHLQIITFRLQRPAGPYRSANNRHRLGYSVTSSVRPGTRHSPNGRYGIFDRCCTDHSALMLAARITLRHFSVSSATSLPARPLLRPPVGFGG